VKAKVIALDRCGGVAICTLQKSKLSATSTLDQLAIGMGHYRLNYCRERMVE
jgi:hypothetical protein